MRLGTDVVAVCWAEQMDTNNRVEMAIARVVLKRRIEAPCGRSPGFNIFGVNDFEPWLTKRSASVITSKAANGYHFKTGQRKWPSGTRLFYPAASCEGKSVLVRQLRGPHLSTCPWCKRRSSMALTAAASPSSLPQSSTGRFEVSMVLARS